MPSPTTALDIIRIAMMHIGVLAEGETPTADQATDGLRALNDVLETWSLQNLAVYGSALDTYATVAGQSMYTFGPAGNFNADRPVSIDSLYTTVNGVDYPASAWTLDEYEAVGIKTQRAPIVERFVFINDAPLARLILYPTPSAAVPIVIDSPRILTAVAAVGNTLTLPPGYARALQYAVAVELQPQYGSPLDMGGRAQATLAVIKRANRTPRVASFDSTVMGGYRGARGSILG